MTIPMKRPEKITIGETAPAKPRRFMRQWSVTERDGTYEVRDAAGLNLATVHFEDQPARQSHLRRLSKDEARRVAAQIARLPTLLRFGEGYRSGGSVVTRSG
jgi:hypothetical protein